MEYLFDTNIFVESKKNLPMDVWTTFWAKMVELINSGTVHSIDKVKDEIDKGGDELTAWIHDNAPRGFFLAPRCGGDNEIGRNSRMGKQKSNKIHSRSN